MTTFPRLQVFSALALRHALEGGVLDDFRSRSGVELDVVFGSAAALLTRVETGTRPDVAVAVTTAVRQLANGRAADWRPAARLGRVGMGVAVADDAPLPDISTVDAFVRTLRGARSVAYSRGGATGTYLQALFERLGILNEMSQRGTVLDGGYTADAIRDGRADLAIQQMTELVGVTIVGPLPAEAQNYTEFSVVARSGNPQARLLHDHLCGEAARTTYAASGLDVERQG